MRVAKELTEINEMIAALEYVGFSVQMFHEHYEPHWELNGHAVQGQTVFSIAFIQDGELLEEYLGFAHCSASDNFSTKTGAAMSFSRAMKEFSREYGRHQVLMMLKLYRNRHYYEDL